MYMFYLTESFAADVVCIKHPVEGIVFGDTLLDEGILQNTPSLMEWNFRLSGCGKDGPELPEIYICGLVDMRALVMTLLRRSKGSIIKILKEEAAIERLGLLTRPLRIGALGKRDCYLSSAFDCIKRRNIKAVRLAVINPWANAVGDSIGALTVLREVQRQFRCAGITVEVHLFQVPCRATEYLYHGTNTNQWCSVSSLPMSVDKFQKFDCYIDLSERVEAKEATWIDSRLRCAGANASHIQMEHKRNRLALKQSVSMKLGPIFETLRKEGRELVILHGLASAMERTMPESVMKLFARAILAHTEYIIITVAPFDLRDERVVDLSGVMGTLEAYMYCISQVDAFVSVDTSLAHIADAFDIPGVVLFTVEAVGGWVSYYPFVEGLQVSQPTGDHRMDYEAIIEGWMHVDVGEVLTHLNRVVEKKRKSLGQRAAEACVDEAGNA